MSNRYFKSWYELDDAEPNVCECGAELGYDKSLIFTVEQRVCPSCGRVHYVDETPIDWHKNFAAHTALELVH